LSAEIIHGNIYDKFHSSNRLTRWLMNRYLSELDSSLLSCGQFTSVLEIGAGDGVLLDYVVRNSPHGFRACALDIGFEVLKNGKKLFPRLPFLQGTAEIMPFRDNEFDLVLALEVFEHLYDPQRSLSEINRVGKNFFIFSVPREPLWRIGNFFSGRYLAKLGNTPGHLQHWTKTAIVRLIRSEMDVLHVSSPVPWTMIFARKH
jgi:ubiquinone/menaquinone biosynthesis C-methylase UbiE